MIRCPSCGQDLPERAKYCARCGGSVAVAPAWSATPTVPPPPGAPPAVRPVFGPGSQVAPPRASPRPKRAVPVWLLVLFYAGAVVPLFLGLDFVLAAVEPHLANRAGSGYTDAQVRSSATMFAATLLVLFAAQLVAAVGLTLNQGWGRLVATFVCLAWMVTLLGIPVSVLALSAIWRRSEP